MRLPFSHTLVPNPGWKASRPGLGAALRMAGILGIVGILWNLGMPLPASAAEPPLDLQGVDLQAMVPGAISFYNEHAAEPLSALTKEQIEQLGKREVVVIRRKEGRAENPEEVNYRVFGYLLIQQPLQKVWLAGMHPEYVRSDTYVFERYAEDGLGGSTAYMYIRTPWPLADRQTVIVATMNSEMAAASDGFVWEQGWHIAQDQEHIADILLGEGRVDGVDDEMKQKAVWLPINYGSFALFRFANKLTMLGWSLTTSIGGLVPDSLVSAFAAQELKGSLKDLEERAAWIESVYYAEEIAIFDVYGRLIPTTGTGNPDPRSSQ